MYEINYDDQRFQDVEKEKQDAIDKSDEMYDGMIGNSDKYYQDQIDATRNWTDEQKELQQEQTDLTLKQIEQQKEQAEKDYTKEQKASYVDWQKESNKYGANAEQMAEQGLQNSGYAESSQVSMYNTYQNRVATARESWQTAKQNYDNAMKEAQLQNSATLAEIAYQGLQQELQLSLQGFQYKNELLMAKANAKTQILGRYDTQYQAVLDQMNTENALKENIRQYNMEYQLKTQEKEYQEFLLRKEIEKANDYDKALLLLRRKGLIAEDDAAGLIDRREWAKRKSVKVPYSKEEHPEMGYDNYEEYLSAYLSYMLGLE